MSINGLRMPLHFNNLCKIHVQYQFNDKGILCWSVGTYKSSYGIKRKKDIVFLFGIVNLHFG